MRFDILTIFPNIFDSYLKESIIKRAIEENKIQIVVHDIRTYSKNRHKKVDAPPFGGGPGMVMMPQPIYDCIKEVKQYNDGPVIYLSPKGKVLTQPRAHKIVKTCLRKQTGLILLCGRYEGIDQRIIDLVVDEELSIGKYVLTGGELPALVTIDVLTRLIPGVLGDDESSNEESFSKALEGKREYPHYTKPVNFEGLEVPAVLRSGHHANIKKWRREKLS
jgi:tRNA (guanine37-N1)-methyltransferase